MLPLHPKLIHLPIALAILMPLVSIALFWVWRARRAPRRIWIVAAGLQLLLAASGFAALRAGEQDEERVERVVPKAAIEAHAEAAEAFVWAAGGVLVVFLAAVVIRREPLAQALAGLACLGTLVVLGLGYRAGEAGGRLVYQYGAASAYATAGAPAPGGDALAPVPETGKEKDEGKDRDDD